MGSCQATNLNYVKQANSYAELNVNNILKFDSCLPFQSNKKSSG